MRVVQHECPCVLRCTASVLQEPLCVLCIYTACIWFKSERCFIQCVCHVGNLSFCLPCLSHNVACQPGRVPLRPAAPLCGLPRLSHCRMASLVSLAGCCSFSCVHGSHQSMSQLRQSFHTGIPAQCTTHGLKRKHIRQPGSKRLASSRQHPNCTTHPARPTPCFVGEARILASKHKHSPAAVWCACCQACRSGVAVLAPASGAVTVLLHSRLLAAPCPSATLYRLVLPVDAAPVGTYHACMVVALVRFDAVQQPAWQGSPTACWLRFHRS